MRKLLNRIIEANISSALEEHDANTKLQKYIKKVSERRKDIATILGINGTISSTVDPEGVLKQAVPPIANIGHPTRELARIKLKSLPPFDLETEIIGDNAECMSEAQNTNSVPDIAEKNIHKHQTSDDKNEIWNETLWTAIGKTKGHKSSHFKRPALIKPSSYRYSSDIHHSSDIDQSNCQPPSFTSIFTHDSAKRITKIYTPAESANGKNG